MKATIAAAAASDLPEVAALLEKAGLTRTGLAEAFGHFWVARTNGRLVGVAGLELHGTAALLRSVAVSSDERGRGLGELLVRRVLDAARGSGASRVFLLTESAEPWFRRFGFETVPRTAAPAEMRRSPEFVDRGCASAALMVLGPEPPAP